MTGRFWGSLALACAAWAQSPAFEVASVKQSEPITPELVQSGRLQMGVSLDASYVRISKLSMLELLTLAYQVKGHQLSVQPWMVTQRYDIQAKLPEGAKRGQIPAMMQTLLAERLGVKTHRENRELKVYALVVAKDGPKLKAAAPLDPQVEAQAPAPGGQIRGGLAVGPGGQVATMSSRGNMQMTPGPNGNMHLESKRITMQGLVDTVARYCELPLMNMTGLEGSYEVEVDVSGEEIRNAARSRGVAVTTPVGEGASEPAGVSLRASLEKLGLRIEGRRMPVEVIVVDEALKVPTEN
jgi:uncharacterized protein (TIGR03435 family)